jgi:hypothetical protein
VAKVVEADRPRCEAVGHFGGEAFVAVGVGGGFASEGLARIARPRFSS